MRRPTEQLQLFYNGKQKTSITGRQIPRRFSIPLSERFCDLPAIFFHNPGEAFGINQADGLKRLHLLPVAAQVLFKPGYVQPPAKLVAHLREQGALCKAHGRVEPLAVFVGRGNDAVNRLNVLEL